MAEIEFEKREERAELLDQREGYARKGISFETRIDPLTGHVSRILPFRRRLTEAVIPQVVLEASKKGCPFCPDQGRVHDSKIYPRDRARREAAKGEGGIVSKLLPLCPTQLGRGSFG